MKSGNNKKTGFEDRSRANIVSERNFIKRVEREVKKRGTRVIADNPETGISFRVYLN